VGQSVLLIELSATLRHATNKLLSSQGYDLHICPNFADALTQIQLHQDQGSPYDAVIVGWPAKTDDDADELFTFLLEDENRSLPVLIMAHEADTPKLNWLSNRGHSTLLLWDDYRESANAIGKIIDDQHVISTPTDSQINPKDTQTPIRILFVDDSPTVRVGYRKLLTKNGYDTDTASGVVEAMEKALSNHYDLAIVDYFMPDGTGDTLCRMLRDDPRTSMVTSAIITGTYLNDAIIGSLEAGAVECMFKNEGKELFLARIDAMSRAVRVRNAIEKDHKRLEGILSSVGDGVYGVSPTGDITFINPAGLKILGYSSKDKLIGKSPYTIFHSKKSDGSIRPVDECPLQRAYGNGHKYSSREMSFVHRDGHQIMIECNVFPLHIDGRQEGSVVAFRDITERKLLEDELKWQATHDQLTGLPNRAYFEDQLVHEVKRLNRSHEQSVLLYIDLDRFKYLNDTAGHAAGDQLLVEIGKEISLRLRKADTLARIGGDEFAAILRNIKQDEIESFADDFRAIVENYTFLYKGKDYHVTSSIGITLLNKETSSHGEALANADIACYISKSQGRNSIHMYDADNDAKSTMDMDLGWSSRLRNALATNAFELHFQPIVPIEHIETDTLSEGDGEVWQQYRQKTGFTHTYEALIRMRDSQNKIIPPDSFLPTAERFNLMPEIDRWVIKNGIQKLADLSGYKDLVLSINLSGQTLQDRELIDYIREHISRANIRPEQLCFEITETSAIANFDDASRLINELKRIGCKFSLDDFGSGFCSFSHLKFLTVDTIKIDGIFVQGMLHDNIDQAIIQSIVQIAHSTGKQTIAEYVENSDILQMLKETGVDAVQGYYVSRPMEEMDTENLESNSPATNLVDVSEQH